MQYTLIEQCISPNVGKPFSSVQSLSRVRLFSTPWITAHQASLSITNSRSSLKITSIESVIPSNHLILCRPLLLLPPLPPSIRFFSNESTLHMRWPKDWSFSFSIIPSKEPLTLYYSIELFSYATNIFSTYLFENYKIEYPACTFLSCWLYITVKMNLIIVIS